MCVVASIVGTSIAQKVLKLITACREHDMNALTETLESDVDPNSANQVKSQVYAYRVIMYIMALY